MIPKLFIVTAITSLAIFSLPTFADKYKCSCLDSTADKIEANKNARLECNETFKASDTGELTQSEGQLKVYLPGSEHHQSDTDVTYKFRPRDGKCLVEIFDGHDNKNSGQQLVNPQWEGMMCDNGNKKKIGGFKLKAEDLNGTEMYTSYWAVMTTGKTYKGTTIYLPRSDDKRLIALCLQNK